MANADVLYGATGTAVPVVARSQLDQTGDTSLTRPSVLLGLGLGSVVTGAGYALDQGIIGGGGMGGSGLASPLMGIGTGHIIGGLYSLFFPKGSGFTAPV
jgi:hypothetical protein